MLSWELHREYSILGSQAANTLITFIIYYNQLEHTSTPYYFKFPHDNCFITFYVIKELLVFLRRLKLAQPSKGKWICCDKTSCQRGGSHSCEKSVLGVVGSIGKWGRLQVVPKKNNDAAQDELI